MNSIVRCIGDHSESFANIDRGLEEGRMRCNSWEEPGSETVYSPRPSRPHSCVCLFQPGPCHTPLLPSTLGSRYKPIESQPPPRQGHQGLDITPRDVEYEFRQVSASIPLLIFSVSVLKQFKFRSSYLPFVATYVPCQLLPRSILCIAVLIGTFTAAAPLVLVRFSFSALPACGPHAVSIVAHCRVLLAGTPPASGQTLSRPSHCSCKIFPPASRGVL